MFNKITLEDFHLIKHRTGGNSVINLREFLILRRLLNFTIRIMSLEDYIYIINYIFQ